MTMIGNPHRKPIAESNLLIAGTARDVGHCIKKEIKHLITCAKEFKTTQVLIIESDSSDDTVACLNLLNQEFPQVDFVSLGQLSSSIPSRTQRLSYCRNQIVQAARSQPKYQSVDFIMLADLDGVNDLLSYEKISQCWEVQEDWDVICANQQNYYYDVWALRHPFWNPHNYLEQYQELLPWMGEHQAHQISLAVKQIKLSPTAPLIPVDSAFGGLGIYKKEAYISSEYGFIPGNVDEVDHAPFHHRLTSQGYKIYINPALINCDEPRLHPKDKAKKRFFLRLLRWVGNFLLSERKFNKYLDILREL
jgi:hypothetical protein